MNYYDSKLADLSVLLTITPLVVGCAQEDDTEDSPAEVVAPDTEGEASDSSTTGSGTDSGMDVSTDAGDDVGDDDPLPATTTGETCEADIQFTEWDPVCTALADKFEQCDFSYWNCKSATADYCEYMLQYTYSFDYPCYEATVELFTCMSELECGTFTAPGSCTAEFSYASSVCER